MKVTPIARQLIACRDFTMSNPKQAIWTLGAILLEALARVQGNYDYWRKREHHIWQAVESTKDLEAGYRKIRRICNAQSVIVFRFILEGAEQSDVHHEATEAACKLLPYLRTKMRKEDKLSVNDAGIMTAVIRAEQHGAEIVARRIKKLVESSTVRVGAYGSEVKVTVVYSSLTFASKAPNGSMTINGPLVDEAMIAALAANNEM